MWVDHNLSVQRVIGPSDFTPNLGEAHEEELIVGELAEETIGKSWIGSVEGLMGLVGVERGVDTSVISNILSLSLRPLDTIWRVVRRIQWTESTVLIDNTL